MRLGSPHIVHAETVVYSFYMREEGPLFFHTPKRPKGQGLSFAHYCAIAMKHRNFFFPILVKLKLHATLL